MSYQPSQLEHAIWQTVDFSSADLSPRIFESGYNMGHLASGRISQCSVVRPSCVHLKQSNLTHPTPPCPHNFLNFFLRSYHFQILPPFSTVVDLLVCQTTALSDVFLRSQKIGNEMLTFRVFRHFRTLSDNWWGRPNFKILTAPACSPCQVWLF